MKRILLSALIVVFALGMAIKPVLARAPVEKGRPDRVVPKVRPFLLVGKVVDVDATAKTITVKVITGNSQVKDVVGQNLTAAIGGRTRLVSFADPRTTIALEGVKANDIVAIQGIYRPALEKSHLAGRVMVGVPFAAP